MNVSCYTLTRMSLASTQSAPAATAVVPAWRERLQDVDESGTFNYAGKHVSDKSVDALGPLLMDLTVSGSLVTLNLARNPITDAGAMVLGEALLANIPLATLQLSSCKIGTSGAAALASALFENTHLTHLALGGNCIGDGGSNALAECIGLNKTLRTLDMRGNKIGNAGLKNWQKLKWNQSLTAWDLSENVINCFGMAALANGLRSNTSLLKLNLAANKIANVGAETLAQAIRGNTVLRELDLERNQLAAGVEAMGVMLKTNTSLNWLSLVYTGVGVSGAKFIANGLKENTALTHLNLAFNTSVGNIGATALAAALRVNTTLHVLNLSASTFSIEAFSALTNGIKINHGLTTLILDTLQIHGDSCAAALGDALKSNSHLEHLSLKGNTISDAGAKDLAAALKV